MDRRAFLGKSTGAVAALAALGPGCQLTPTLPVPNKRPWLTRPERRGARGRLVADTDAQVDLGDGRWAPAWGFDGVTPGPLLTLRRGEALDVELENRLSQETTVHWHGLLPPSEMDGHPADAVPPGSAFRYRFPIEQRACLAWYHPHPHEAVSEQVYRGLVGPLVVTDEAEERLGLPRGEDEDVLVLGDAELGRDGRSLRYRPGASSDRGSFPLVNGAAFPQVSARSGMRRVRILSAARARVFDLGFSGIRSFLLIGNDGGFIDAPTRLERVVLGPGERVDLLLDFGELESGRRVELQCLRARWDLLTFEIEEREGENQSASVRSTPSLPPIRTHGAAEVRTERVFDFQGHHRINGRRFHLDRIEFRVPFGALERWVFRSSGGAPHPVHVHGTHFQVENRRGGRGRVLPWERGWKDTVLLQEGEEVSVLLRFDQYRGRYLLHCHRLEHEDGGMMLNFEVE